MMDESDLDNTKEKLVSCKELKFLGSCHLSIVSLGAWSIQPPPAPSKFKSKMFSHS